uniref:Transcription elongation factor Spt5 n=1 Tax=uncultured marine thaumarchaeote KM3_75_C09 TaxID=1456277 RepID=A0A075HR07_9ARCH|nr:NusG antitermination factor (nusG) [uncultured marine thaumarchaeote KM3_75_C09]
MSEPESSDGQQPESITEPVTEPEPTPEPVAEPTPEPVAEPEPTPEPVAEPETVAEPEPTPEPVAEPEPTPEPVAATETETDGNSHLFAVRTTGGQEKIVMRLLEARIKMEKINIQSVVLLSDLKGYVVVEARDVSAMFDAIQGIRHVRGQLRGELTYNEIDKYLIKKSTVSELAVENTVEIIGGPFKGMKATITRVDQEKEEATVILLDATYQLPVTVDANYLKLVPA